MAFENSLTNFFCRRERKKPTVQRGNPRKQGTFDFDQRIGMNVIGKIGEKLRVTANFDNNTSFDFENDLRVEYTGFEEDIIKKIEIGNVSMGINNSLIRGSQNLFGVKTELQFGKLFVTGLFSTQRGSSDAITIEGGSQAREFEFSSADYDENRHFFLQCGDHRMKTG